MANNRRSGFTEPEKRCFIICRHSFRQLRHAIRRHRNLIRQCSCIVSDDISKSGHISFYNSRRSNTCCDTVFNHHVREAHCFCDRVEDCVESILQLRSVTRIEKQFVLKICARIVSVSDGVVKQICAVFSRGCVSFFRRIIREDAIQTHIFIYDSAHFIHRAFPGQKIAVEVRIAVTNSFRVLNRTIVWIKRIVVSICILTAEVRILGRFAVGKKHDEERIVINLLFGTHDTQCFFHCVFPVRSGMQIGICQIIYTVMEIICIRRPERIRTFIYTAVEGNHGQFHRTGMIYVIRKKSVPKVQHRIMRITNTIVPGCRYVAHTRRRIDYEQDVCLFRFRCTGRVGVNRQRQRVCPVAIVFHLFCEFRILRIQCRKLRTAFFHIVRKRVQDDINVFVPCLHIFNQTGIFCRPSVVFSGKGIGLQISISKISLW